MSGAEWWQQQQTEMQEMECDIEQAKQKYERGLATPDDVKLLVWARVIQTTGATA